MVHVARRRDEGLVPLHDGQKHARNRIVLRGERGSPAEGETEAEFLHLKQKMGKERSQQATMVFAAFRAPCDQAIAAADALGELFATFPANGHYRPRCVTRAWD